jgi:hypothetical protein
VNLIIHTPPTAMDQRPARVLGGVWLGMGLATMLAPRPIARLSFTRALLGKALPASGEPTPDDALPIFLLRCFGAQAAVTGLALSVATFDRAAYAAIAAAVAPFFAFDAWAYALGYLTPFGALGDAAGNVVFMACAWAGMRGSRR